MEYSGAGWKFKPVDNIDVNVREFKVIQKIPFSEWNFRYAVWGVVSQSTDQFCGVMKKFMPNAKLVAGIESADEGSFCGSDIIIFKINYGYKKQFLRVGKEYLRL